MPSRLPDAWPRGMPQEVAAAYLGVSESTLRSQVDVGAAPEPVRIGRRIVWLREDLDAYLDRLANRASAPRSAVMEAIERGKGRAALR